MILSNPAVNISVIYPTSNIDVAQNEFFNVTLNVSCVSGSCGTVNVSLDPEMIEEIIGREVLESAPLPTGMTPENGSLGVAQSRELGGKSFFERVVEFVFWND